MRARRYFGFGDRVVLTLKGAKAGLQGRARTPYGIVIDEHVKGGLVVVRYGLYTAEKYHVSYWQKVSRFPWEAANASL